MERTIVFSETVLTSLLILLLLCGSVRGDYKYDYYDFNEMEALLTDLETQSSSKTPDVYSLSIIGYSTQNNPLYAVKFSDNPGTEEDAEPDVLIDAGIHSNEWLGSESTIRYIEYLFDAYYDTLHPDHAEVASLIENFEIWIIPMINPDGRIRDDPGGGDPESFWTDTTYHSEDTVGWRMNVQEVSCSARPDGTNIGIDINRTFSYKFWELSDCETTIYNGGTAFSAPEARVIKQFVHNHMISLILHQHSNAQLIFSASGAQGLGAYLSNEAAGIYNDDPTIPDPIMALWTPPITSSVEGSGSFASQSIPERYKQYVSQQSGSSGEFLISGLCAGSRFSGQYFNWAWEEIGDPVDCPLAPDNHSRRAIQMIMYEYPYDDEMNAVYGHPSEGKIGQYLLGDSSNGFHPSSGETNQWVIEKSREINKYFIQQSRYPFSPRNHTDLSPRPEAPVTDLAMVGAKISEVGTGLPGCLGYDNLGRDTLLPGDKRVTWNVQNNGTANRTIDSGISICNLTDDPGCLSATSALLSRVEVTPESIETFTYDHTFSDPGACKIYSVTLETGESNEYDNDLKRFIFALASPADSDCDGYGDGSDNCPATTNGEDLGSCVKLVSGILMGSGVTCRDDVECVTGETCQMWQGDINGDGIGDACQCYADIDCNNKVDLADLVTMKGEFLEACPPSPCSADLNGDVKVDLSDLVILKTEFLKTGCPQCP